MFGIGKTKNKKEKKTKAAPQKSVGSGIPDDKFTVMPSKYRPEQKNSSGPKVPINKKFIFLGGAVFIVLAVISSALYFVFFVNQESGTQELSIEEKSPNSQDGDISKKAEKDNIEEEEKEEKEEEGEKIKEKTIEVQAFDDKNALLGSLSITVPATLVQSYGSGIGATVLDSDDISLPEDGQVLGGLYSMYPGGVTFEEPVSFEMSFSSVPSGAEQADIYPAYLRGVRWQELEDYQAVEGGFSFVLEKFPNGSLAVVWDNSEAATSADSTIEYKEPEPSADKDEDGLTDKEEDLIGTDYSVKDTDEDGYNDLEEIQNGYSPISSEVGLLSESGIFAEYTNETYGYEVSYPSSWLADSLDNSNKQVLFISETEEFFEILVEENPLNTPIVDWYRSQSPSLESADLDVFIVDSRPAVWSPDKTTLYTSKDGLIYIITYNKGTRDTVNWPNIFKHFYKSFTFGNTNGSGDDEQEGDGEGEQEGDGEGEQEGDGEGEQEGDGEGGSTGDESDDAAASTE